MTSISGLVFKKKIIFMFYLLVVIAVVRTCCDHSADSGRQSPSPYSGGESGAAVGPAYAARDIIRIHH